MENSDKGLGFGKGSLFSRLKSIKNKRMQALQELGEFQRQCSHEDVLWVYADDEYYQFQIYACPDCLLYEDNSIPGRHVRVFKSFKDIKGKPKNRLSVHDYLAPYRDRLHAIIERCEEIAK